VNRTPPVSSNRFAFSIFQWLSSGGKNFWSALACRSLVRRAAFFGVIAKLVRELETFFEKLRYAALAVGDFVADHELTVYAHVVDRVELERN
jgi:hypothetical protein